MIIYRKFLDKTVKCENNMKNGSSCLITSRQYFFDRIFWCIARTRSLLLSINDDVLSQSLQEKDNFFSTLDQILEMLEDFTESHEKNTNEAVNRAELMMTSKRIREQVEHNLLASNFLDVVLESDKNPIDCLSKNLLATVSKLVDEFSLTHSRRGKSSQQKMVVMELENELISFERLISDALLRVVYEVFNDLSKIQIRKLCKSDLDSSEKIQKFHLLMERLIHIGNFSMWFNFDDFEDNSILKSCLASIESLHSLLIHSSIDKEDPSLEILQLHFDEECDKFQHVVHKVIESKSFCRSLIEKNDKCCEKNQKFFNKVELVNLLEHSKILLFHLQVNSESLKLTSDFSFQYNDFKLILNECDAILNFDDDSLEFNKRILKRFNILRNKTEKLLSAMNQQDNSSPKNNQSQKSSKIKDETRQKSEKIHKMSVRQSLRMKVLKKNFKDEIGSNETSLDVTEILKKMSTLLN